MEKIKDLRIRKGITQDELAKMLGIKRTTCMYREMSDSGNRTPEQINILEFLNSLPDSKKIKMPKKVSTSPLRRIRFERNITLQDLSYKTKASVAAIVKWEAGTYRPSPYYLIKLCSALNCVPSELGFDSVLDDQAYLNSHKNVIVEPKKRGPKKMEKTIEVVSDQFDAKAFLAERLFDGQVFTDMSQTKFKFYDGKLGEYPISDRKIKMTELIKPFSIFKSRVKIDYLAKILEFKEVRFGKWPDNYADGFEYVLASKNGWKWQDVNVVRDALDLGVLVEGVKA